MAFGSGKYDDLATYVRVQAAAAGVAVIVFNGRHGEGFSVQATDPQFLNTLPAVLRNMADDIEADARLAREFGWRGP